MLFYILLQARSSVGERFLDAEEAKGSIPFAPTIFIRYLVPAKEVTDKSEKTLLNLDIIVQRITGET